MRSADVLQGSSSIVRKPGDFAAAMHPAWPIRERMNQMRIPLDGSVARMRTGDTTSDQSSIAPENDRGRCCCNYSAAANTVRPYLVASPQPTVTAPTNTRGPNKLFRQAFPFAKSIDLVISDQSYEYLRGGAFFSNPLAT